jgi:DNA-binding ferritin-like protein
MNIYQKIIATLRSLTCYYQTCHWLSKGSQYYGDHLLFMRLYDATILDIDGVGEKAIGVTQDEASVDLRENINAVAKILNNMEYDPDRYFESALKLEKAFVKACEDLAKDVNNSEGVKNMFAGLADKHEGHIYLLQQRIKGLKVI